MAQLAERFDPVTGSSKSTNIMLEMRIFSEIQKPEERKSTAPRNWPAFATLPVIEQKPSRIVSLFKIEEHAAGQKISSLSVLSDTGLTLREQLAELDPDEIAFWHDFFAGGIPTSPWTGKFATSRLGRAVHGAQQQYVDLEFSHRLPSGVVIRGMIDFLFLNDKGGHLAVIDRNSKLYLPSVIIPWLAACELMPSQSISLSWYHPESGKVTPIEHPERRTSDVQKQLDLLIADFHRRNQTAVQ
jgi:hypothetical protein